MQLVADRDELLGAVVHVVGAADKAATIPILSHLVLTVYAEKGTIRATNLAIEVTAPFTPQAVTEQGRICVPARIFHDIIKRMPEGKPISLLYLGGVGTGGGKLRIVCGKFKAEIGTLNADDHPGFTAPANKETRRFEIDAAQLRRLLAGVRHAIDKTEGRYYLQGAYLHVVGETLKAVATNGHVLALQACAAPVGAYGMPGAIIPDATVGHMLKMLPDEDQLVELRVSKAVIWLDLPNGLCLGSKLIDGTYPDYLRVIPDPANRVSCFADALSVSVDRVSTVLTEKVRSVVVALNPKGGLTVKAESAAVGTAKDSCEAADKATKRAEIGFNPRYLSQILAAYAGHAVEVRYDGPDSATLFTLIGETSETSLQVLMPMRHNMAEDAEEEKEAA